ncbi:hypothetical protein BDV95DRAFT_85486 [Massariosphaeria phaeospora]|uniref:F-box domain-containing protein n=1 Tax=Massariosphaeria phaeospora TaxID=100035 RepID=A0A7C8ICI2_9PLEO|nr:hypothetical protein BDV95DRAFT_85486 [Massariosphaeria phaeospora]
MDRNRPSTTTAFNRLPIELNKTIAHCLETDKDIYAFRRICRATDNACDGDNHSFWRAKFREKYALKAGTPNNVLKAQYLKRGKWLNRSTTYPFHKGQERREIKALAVLRDLIAESFQGSVQYDEYGRARCPNQTQLVNFIMNSKIVFGGRRPPSDAQKLNPALAATKLMCAHFLFDLDGPRQNVLAVEESQIAVYAPSNVAPLFTGQYKTDVNMEWVLHSLDLFRCHMTNVELATLYSTMSDLPVSQKPSAWRGLLKHGCYPLSKHWKGTYTFLEQNDIDKLRDVFYNNKSSKKNDLFFVDGNVEEGKIQSLELDFTQDGDMSWPEIFEDRLHSLRETGPPRTRAQHRSGFESPNQKHKNIHFVGKGEDLNDNFFARGWLNALPTQCGIPGWQRITFMKHFVEGDEELNDDNLWAYEGVVLPGGRIILGRWWYASGNVNLDDDYNGPFIFWAVEEPELEDEEDSDDDH